MQGRQWMLLRHGMGSQPTCDNGNLAQKALGYTAYQHHSLQAQLHILHELLVLFVLCLVIHQRTALALPAIRHAQLRELAHTTVTASTAQLDTDVHFTDDGIHHE